MGTSRGAVSDNGPPIAKAVVTGGRIRPGTVSVRNVFAYATNLLIARLGE
jgi:hypothetical protein